MQERFDLGLDLGSVSVSLAVLDPSGKVLKEVYRRHLGEPFGAALQLLQEVDPEFGFKNCRLMAFTGLGGKVLAELLGGHFVNEVIAQAKGTFHFHPEANSIMTWGARTPNSSLSTGRTAGAIYVGLGFPLRAKRHFEHALKLNPPNQKAKAALSA